MIIDLHCHVLPGIDDGAKDIETTLEMCRIAEHDGVSAIIATPHYIHGSINNTRNLVHDKVAELNHNLQKQNINVAIYPGCEVFICPELPQLVSNAQVCTLNNTRYVLIELPMTSVPEYTIDVIYKLKLNGYTPVIAHPERNSVIGRDPNILFDLMARGVLTQVNASSIKGLFGKEIKDTALKLIDCNMMHLLASDAHTTGGRSPKLSSAMKVIAEHAGDEVLQGIIRNGQAVLRGEIIEIDEPVRIERKVRTSLVGNFMKRVSSGLFR